MPETGKDIQPMHGCYFYRDYKRALKDIEEYDALTPNFVDYPQWTSVNYMRGI